MADVLHDDGPLTVDDIRWRLSQINPNRPSVVVRVPDDLRTASLLCQDIVELETLVTEWQGIAESYRELAQLAIEQVTEHDRMNRRLTARMRDLMEVSRPRA